MKIFTCNDVSPEFVELQVASFRKYLQENFEFTVLNGGEAIGCYPEKAKEVSRICRSLSVPVIDVQRDSEIEAVRDDKFRYPGYTDGPLFGENGRYTHGVGGHSFNYMLNWAWQRILSKERGPICFLHSDVFLMEPIKLTDYLKEHELCAIITGKAANDKHGVLEWIWEPLLLADMPKLPNPETVVWWPTFVEGEWADTGGPTHYWLKAHPEIRLMRIGQSGCQDDPAVNFHPARYGFFHLDAEERRRAGVPAAGDKKVFHYYSGSGWCQKDPGYHKKKLAWTRKLIGVD